MRLLSLTLILLFAVPVIAAEAKSCDPPCTSKEECRNGRCQAVGAKPAKPKPLPRKLPEK